MPEEQPNEEQEVAAQQAAEELEAHEEEEQETNEEDDEPRSVDSTMISEWGYNREAEEIEVTFNNGRAETYPCSPQQWESAKEAPSAGKWMHENVL